MTVDLSRRNMDHFICKLMNIIVQCQIRNQSLENKLEKVGELYLLLVYIMCRVIWSKIINFEYFRWNFAQSLI